MQLLSTKINSDSLYAFMDTLFQCSVHLLQNLINLSVSAYILDWRTAIYTSYYIDSCELQNFPS
jgi:hypothetical protein